MKLPLKSFGEVPEWNTYYPSLSQATAEQKRFYMYWLKQLEKGNFVSIEGNLSYVFVYLYSVVQRFMIDKDLDRLLQSLEKVNSGYGKYEKIRDYLARWPSDAYLYLGNYDKAWEARKGLGLQVTEVIDLRAKCKDTSIDGQDLMCILGTDTDLTEFGKKHQKEIADLATIFLRDFHKEHGSNLIEHLCRQFDFASLSEDDFSQLKEFYPNEKDFIFWRRAYEREKKKYPRTYRHYLFIGAPLSTPHIEREEIPYIITLALTNEGKRILRECENTLREEKDLPRAGEGWIGETELFYQLREAFPNEKLVHHGRPAWLSPQHLDIYFSLRNVAIEYQGAQHQNPVQYFGGQKAFEEQRKRDRRKRRLCENHGCKLIYVYEGYAIEEVIEQVNGLLIDC